MFGVAALATLVAGALAEESGTAAADHVGLSGVLFGATVLAAATSLPELSTGLTSVREGDYKLAFGDIFGGNAFLPVLFLLAVLVSGKAVLPNAHASDIYLTGLGALLTVVYMAGLLFRPAKQHARLGIDSIAVLVLYVIGVVGLVALPDSTGGSVDAALICTACAGTSARCSNFEPPATDEEVAAAALQFVRKISGTTKPSQANAEAFDRAVAEVAAQRRPGCWTPW